MTPPYRYEPRVLTESRLDQIALLVDGLKDEAANDIEDKRAIYEALVDLQASVVSRALAGR